MKPLLSPSDRKFGTQKFQVFFSDFCKYIDRFLPAICEVSSRQYSTYIFAIERFHALLESAKLCDDEFYEMSKLRKNKKINKNGVTNCTLLPVENEDSGDLICDSIETYVKYYLYDFVIKHLLIGFELELYTKAEFLSVFFVLEHFLNLHIETLTKIIKYFRIENNKFKTNDYELRQICSTLESRLTRYSSIFYYGQGMISILVNENLKNQNQNSKKFVSKFFNPKKLFKSRFSTLFTNLGMDIDKFYLDYLTRIEQEESDFKNLNETGSNNPDDNNLIIHALKKFQISDNYISNLSTVEGFVWSVGPICRMESSELAVRPEMDRFVNIIKSNVVSCKLEKMVRGKKNLKLEVDLLCSLPILKLV